MSDKQTVFSGFNMSRSATERVSAQQPKCPPSEPIEVEVTEQALLEPSADLTLHLVHNGGRVKPVQFCGFEPSFKRVLIKPHLDGVRPLCLRTGRLMGGAKARQWRLYEPELKECRAAWVKHKAECDAKAKEAARERQRNRLNGVG